MCEKQTDLLIGSVQVTFVQDGNTLGTTAEPETLTVCIETQDLFSVSDGAEKGDAFFYVIKSETGWSLDSIEDLSSLFARCRRVLE